METIQHVTFYDDVTNKAVKHFDRDSGIEFSSLCAVETVLDVIRIPGANWAKVVSYCGGEFGDQGYGENLYRLYDNKWNNVSEFIFDVGFESPRQHFHRRRRNIDEKNSFESKVVPEELKLWIKRNDIRKTLLNYDPYDILFFPLFQKAEDHTTYAKESYEIAKCFKENNLSIETLHGILNAPGASVDDSAVNTLYDQLRGGIHKIKCPICRRIVFSDSKDEEKCPICGELKKYDKDEGKYVFTTPDDELTERDRELIYYLKNHGEEKDALKKMLADHAEAVNMLSDVKSAAEKQQTGKWNEQTSPNVFSKQIIHLFMEANMQYTKETENWITDMVYTCGASPIVRSLLNCTGIPLDLVVDPGNITFDELSEFPQNKIPKQLVYSLSRKKYKVISDLASISPQELFRIPGVGIRGFCSLCNMLQLFGNDREYGEEIKNKIELLLPAYRESLNSFNLNQDTLKRLKREGCKLPATDWKWFEKNPSDNLLDYYEKKNDPEGYLSYIAALFDEGYSVDPYVEYGYGCSFNKEEDFCLSSGRYERNNNPWGDW